MNEFKISDLISVKFSYPNTEIYISGKYFMQCKRLVLAIPKNDMNQYTEIESIDEAAEIYEHSVHEHEILKDEGLPELDIDENLPLIDPREEFWGHCSNLQMWVENDYNTRLLKANLAFPLLEKLAKIGDERAKIRFKEEIIQRLLSGTEQVIEFLFVEQYIDYINNEELLTGLLETKEAEALVAIQLQLNVEFRFVPSIDRGISFNPPVDSEEIKRIRKFSIENKCIKGLEFKFVEILNLPKELNNLKKLKQIRLKGNFSDLNSDEIIKTVQKLKGVEEIFLRSSLVQNLENTSLKNLKKIGKKIYRLLGAQDFPY